MEEISGLAAQVVDLANSLIRVQIVANATNTASKLLRLVVTISGRVNSDTPISCEHSGLRGVIVEQTAEQHFLKHSDAGSWIQDSALSQSNCNEDDGTSRVYAVGARGASGLLLTVGSEVFEGSGGFLVRGTLDYLQSLKVLGVKRIERVLPTGTPLTVVGEAVKDDNAGTIRIQRPHKGPFYVSPKTIDQLIASLWQWARMERRRHWELRKRVLDAAAKRTGSDNEGSNGKVQSGYDAPKKDRLMPDLCVICLEQEYNSVLVWSYVQLYRVLLALDKLSTLS
ncbi:hypothetical protein LguiA_011453 [Lonicera macranthoides]